jgi:type I restriction enzyme, S subunit
MTTEAFFKKFDLFAGAPNAATKFRELVLELATSGRMLKQNPNDQNSDELLKEIFNIRDKAITQRKLSKRYLGKIITAGDTIELPNTWSRCMISELCDLQTGATPSRQESKYFGGDIPWLVSGDINKREILECDGRITKSGMENSNCKLIPPNSVLIALNGQGKTRGTVALLRIEAALNQSLVAIIPYSRERLLPEFIYWNLRGRYYQIREITGQDQRRGLNMKLVGQLSIPVPPLAEQKRIVAKVDELMALCDRMEAQELERQVKGQRLARAALVQFADKSTQANLGLIFHKAYDVEPVEIRRAILELAVRGKLVERITQDGIASETLNRNGITPSIHEELPQLPDHWLWARIDDILVIMNSGWSPACLAEHANDGAWGVLKTTAVQPLEYLEAENKGLPQQLLPRPEHEVQDGDILFTRAGPFNRVGILCVARPKRSKLMISDKIIRMHFIKYIDPDFAALALGSGYSSRYIEGLKSGMAASQVNISQPKLRSVPIPLPPLDEQKRIVAKVDELMAIVDKLEAQQVRERELAERLMEAAVREMTA